MVQEIEDGAVGHTGPRQPSVRGISRDRWGDIYANMPVRRMVALYDYDPQELSPNVDAEVSPEMTRRRFRKQVTFNYLDK